MAGRKPIRDAEAKRNIKIHLLFKAKAAELIREMRNYNLVQKRMNIEKLSSVTMQVETLNSKIETMLICTPRVRQSSRAPSSGATKKRSAPSIESIIRARLARSLSPTFGAKPPSRTRATFHPSVAFKEEQQEDIAEYSPSKAWLWRGSYLCC